MVMLPEKAFAKSHALANRIWAKFVAHDSESGTA
jgi:hypothetical protein